jgi:hypothetical protein
MLPMHGTEFFQMKKFRFAVLSIGVSVLSFFIGRLLSVSSVQTSAAQSEHGRAESLDSASLVMPSPSNANRISLAGKIGRAASPEENVRMMRNFKMQHRLEKMIETYDRLPSAERKAPSTFLLGMSYGEYDVAAGLEWAGKLTNTQEKRSAIQGIIEEWCHYAPEDASAFVAGMPDDAEKKQMGLHLGKALLGNDPVSAVKWMAANDDPNDPWFETNAFSRLPYSESVEILKAAPLSDERRADLMEAARVHWNESLVSAGKWTKIVAPTNLSPK